MSDRRSSGPVRPDADPQADVRRIESYLNGEADTFAELDGWIRAEIHARHPTLRREIEDLSQAVHERLVKNLRAGKFHQRSSLRTYVTSIAHHVAIDRIRALYRERTIPSEGWTPGRGATPSPYESIAAGEERQLLYQVILRSPPGCRTLWRMIFLERLSYTEIGKRLSIPPGTVKSRMWHCRRKALALLERLRRAGPPGKDRGG